jgi:hypothetical protein
MGFSEPGLGWAIDAVRALQGSPLAPLGAAGWAPKALLSQQNQCTVLSVWEAIAGLVPWHIARQLAVARSHGVSLDDYCSNGFVLRRLDGSMGGMMGRAG